MSLLTPASARTFSFVDPPPMVDRELQLVEPAERYVEEVLASSRHPLTQRDMPQQARTTRDTLHLYLRQHPRGRTREEPSRGIVPAYAFWMRLAPDHFLPQRPSVPMAGGIGLRIGNGANIELYFGHIGYHVFPPARGQHYAERACRLLFPLARHHGLTTLWITCNPDNLPSRRTCERLGGTMTEIVPVPRDNPLYSQGDREKCRYRINI